jgi:hypothetical protein
MKKKQVASVALKAARRNPRAAFGVVLFATQHWKAIAKTLRLSRSTSRALGKAAEPSVQKDLRLAVGNLTEALARAKKLGIAEAPKDKRVSKHLDTAARHASSAVGEVMKAKQVPSRRPRILGAGLLLAGGWAAWRRKQGKDET